MLWDFLQFRALDIVMLPLFGYFIMTRGFKVVHLHIALLFYVNLIMYRYGSVFGIYTGYYSADHLGRMGAFAEPWNTELLYGTMVCGSLAIGLTVRKSIRKQSLLQGGEFGGFGNQKFQIFVGGAATLLFILSCTHFIDIDKSLLWHNMEYTAVKQYDLAGVTFPPNAVLHRGLKYIPLLASMFLMIAKRRPGHFRRGCEIGYPVFLNMVAHSRSAAISLGLLAFLYIFRKEIMMRILGGSLAIMSFLSLVVALDGRRRIDQGVVGMIDTMANLSPKLIGDNLFHIAATTFNGGIVVSTGLAQPADHGFYFKVLSFSPLPSILDGFTQRCSGEIVKLTANNPYPALSEVISLGPVWTVLFFSLYFGCMFFVARAYNRFGPQIAAAAGLPLLFVGVLMQIYPTRAVSKLLAFSIFIILMIEVFKRAQRKNKLRPTS